MNIIKALDILESHTYFTRYYKDYDSFVNDFKNAIHTYPFEEGGKIKWCLEYGSYDLDDNIATHNYDNDIYSDSYENCIIILAKRLVDKYGEDDLMDYFIIEDKSVEMLIPCEVGSNYMINPNYKTSWKKEDLFEKIREY